MPDIRRGEAGAHTVGNRLVRSSGVWSSKVSHVALQKGARIVVAIEVMVVQKVQEKTVERG